MPKLYSSSEIAGVLQKIGFSFIKQKGSHAKFKNKENKVVILPMNRKEIPQGTLRSILRQAGINYKKFEEILKS
ncbi:MAG TPA: type II toxin-antitoxin system HicA family toxin [bacterium]|nr:type II toxin-antitoxin system HicA family toxin [bacterium]HPP30156.1 type II toxin-antitoxin system HicA family toxin [bacterium]